MAFGKLLITLAVIALVLGDYQHEVETKNKTKKTVAPEKGQKSRSANPTRDRGLFQKLNNLRNRTDRTDRQQSKENFLKIHQLNVKHRSMNDDMLNDNEGAIAINQKTNADNETNSLTDKMKELRKKAGTNGYVTDSKNSYVPRVTGVFCNFEKLNDSDVDMCMWTWNSTVSDHGLGFRVLTAADIVEMNETTRGMKFSGPQSDADNNEEGKIFEFTDYLYFITMMENIVCTVGVKKINLEPIKPEVEG